MNAILLIGMGSALGLAVYGLFLGLKPEAGILDRLTGILLAVLALTICLATQKLYLWLSRK